MLYPDVDLHDLLAEIKVAAKSRSAEGKARYMSLCDKYHKISTARFAEGLRKRRPGFFADPTPITE